MATSEDYAKRLLDKPDKDAVASTYDAEKRAINQTTDTVQGQLDSVLNSDSKYIDRARTSAKQYAQSRGLLNSSIAAQAGESAAIDAAMPIAQQDADTYFRQGLENQAAENTARSTNVQLEQKASEVNATNATSARNAALQTIGALDNQREQDAAAMARTNVTQEAATLRTSMEQEAQTFRTNLSEMAQTDRQNIIAMTDVQTNNARIAADALVNDKKMASEDKNTFTTAYNEMTRQNYVEISNTATDPDLSPDEKNKLIAAQNARYDADTELLAGLYEIPIEITATDSSVFALPPDPAPDPAPDPSPGFSWHNGSSVGMNVDYTLESHSCFTGDSLTVDAFGNHIRVDSIHPGDELAGADGTFNTVIGIEKVPVASRTLWKLDGASARFTGEHPFLMADRSWGSFDKAAMDKELTEDNVTIVETDEGSFRVVGDMQTYDDNTIRQINNGDLGLMVDGKEVELSARTTKDEEDFVYSMFMSGNRTWNIEGIVISGLALTGENPELKGVTE